MASRLWLAGWPLAGGPVSWLVIGGWLVGWPSGYAAKLSDGLAGKLAGWLASKQARTFTTSGDFTQNGQTLLQFTTTCTNSGSNLRKG